MDSEVGRDSRMVSFIRACCDHDNNLTCELFGFDLKGCHNFTPNVLHFAGKPAVVLMQEYVLY